MICSEIELRCSVEWMARMYATEDREVAEPSWSPETRQEQVDDTRFMRLKIEREVAEYLARKYGYIAEPAGEVSAAHRATTDVPTEQAA